MKLNFVCFFKNQMSVSLQNEDHGLDVIELSSADLETVTGGQRCPWSGSNGSPSSFPYGGNPSGNAGYNYGSSPDNGYGSEVSQVTVYEVTLRPSRCPYSSYTY